MESYINTIVDTLNKQLVMPLWKLNGFPMETMPKLCAGDVAPHDLSEISSFLRNLNGAEINVKSQPKTVEALMDIAELPFDKEEYLANLEKQEMVEQEQRDFDRQMAVEATKQPAAPVEKRDPVINIDVQPAQVSFTQPDIVVNVPEFKMEAPVVKQGDVHVHIPKRGQIEKTVTAYDEQGRIVSMTEKEIENE